MILHRLTAPLCVLSLLTASALAEGPLRPPAVPLVVHNPNFSIWSDADRLTDEPTRHWTHHEHPLESLIRVDGTAYRLMGTAPKDVPAFPQTGLRVTPTRSIYDFENEKVHVTLTFMTPALPGDLNVLARPVTYLTWSVRSKDGAAHSVSIYDSAAAVITVNEEKEPVRCGRTSFSALTALQAGSEDQNLLQPAGDDTRIDWGYLYLAAPSAETKSAIGNSEELLAGFASSGKLPDHDDSRFPRPARDQQPVLSFVFDLGQVQAAPVSRHILLGYDEVYSIQFFSEKLRPYWRRDGATPAKLFQDAERDYSRLTEACAKFDEDLMQDLKEAGGERYAQIAALAYRQGLGGCGLAADSNKQPMIFTKENTSNGCIATVDVIYPAAPQFLLLGPAFAKALIAPALVYSASPRWKFSFAPHDLGVYPQSTGMVYGGGESPGHESDKMPVEESGNMIILCDAIAHMDGNADFASKWWPQITEWEKYLEQYGKDPEDQLCTDDFMGHLAHNANLSVKATLAIAAYGDLCRMRGDASAADKYAALARDDAKHWMEVDADGDHYRLAFDKPNSWSQEYNLVWDKLLGLNIFPAKAADEEIAYYKKTMQRNGLPLDSRTHLSKSDWTVWSATLANNKADFESFISPMYDYFNQTTARVALADSYVTDDIHSDGMHARPVIGGVFVKMLAEPSIWKKYYSEGAKAENHWADFPPEPRITEIVPTSRKSGMEWRYSAKAPAADWMQPGFSDLDWKQGPGGFGTSFTPGSVVRTTWNSDDIWLRRTVVIPSSVSGEPQFVIHHDEDVEIYVNGILAARESGYISEYKLKEIRPEAAALLKPGATVTLAVHCHQTTGGQYIDVGIASVEQPQGPK